MLHAIGKKFSRIVTVEDGVITGGMGTAVNEFMSQHGYKPQIRCIGIPDRFVEHGTTQELYRSCGMDNETILETILNI